MRARLASLFAAALIVGSCGASPTPSSSTASPSVAPTTLGPSPTVTVTPSASPTPTVVGHWEAAGTMSLGRYAPHTILLTDGLVIVAGNDTERCIRDNTVQTERWAPSEGWSQVPSFDQPRAEFVAVPLADGRLLVTAGVDAGNAREAQPGWSMGAAPPVAGHKSYASTYILDPRQSQPAWSRAASLGTARTAPAGAVLADGRVLVAGGYYLSGAERPGGTASTIVLAVYRPGPILADEGPPPTIVPAMATGELYDPARNTWSATGPMHYARVAPGAVTLADGRVLVVGSSPEIPTWHQWNYTSVRVADRAYQTAEIFDPRTGRFTLTGELPPIDWSPLASLGLSNVSATFGDGADSGTLVALKDGGALLVGRTEDWYADVGDGSEGYVARTLRFDPVTGQWTEIDRSLWMTGSDTREVDEIVRGHVAHRAAAAALADGRVLVAGGERLSGPDAFVALDAAQLFDPAIGAWTALPPMPEHRAGGAAVGLLDGSALLVGGSYESASPECDEGSTGLRVAVLFVPEP